MRSYSLRRRLLILAAVWAAVAITILGGVLAALLAHSIQRGAEERLQAGMDRLVSVLDANGGVVGDMLPDPLYAIPASGAYWQITDLERGHIERSRSLWDFTLDEPGPGGQPTFSEIRGPSDQALLSLTQTITRPEGEGERRYRITLAALKQSAAVAVEGFGRNMAVALAFLFTAIVLAAGLQMRLVFEPLGRLSKSVKEIRESNSTGIRGSHPDELRPLINELNDLLVIRENSLQFARARAADLAHGIKTPLSVFLSLADDLDAKGDHSNADLVRELSSEISDRIAYQLQLARLRVRSQSEVISTSLQESLRRIISVLRRTHKGERLRWELELDDEVAVDIDKHDLIELLGTILENACKWASSTVQVSVSRGAEMASISIADDGPGVTDDQIAALGFRGRRFDESRPGSGMGLSIAKDIVSLNNGTLGYSRSKLGGLAVDLSLPMSRGETRLAAADE